MPYLALLLVLLQILVAVHVIKTGRSTSWLMLVLFIPLLGSIAYFLIEILPELRGSRAGRTVVGEVGRLVAPERDYRRLQEELERAPSVENKMRLAEEALRLGRPAEAARLYESCLVGLHATDPAVMHGLARAVLDSDPARTQRLLDELRAANPDWQSADAHLLYARSLEAQGRADESLDEYAALEAYAPGREAQYRAGLLLLKRGRSAEGQAKLKALVREVELGGRNAMRSQGEWYRLAKQELSGST